MAVITAAVGVGIAAVGVGVSIKAANDAKSANKKVGRANAAIAKLENARSRRKQIREERIQQGSIAARASVSGGGGGFGTLASSSARGQAEGVRSQLKSNLRHLDESTRLSSIASNESIKASTATTNAAIGGAVANAGLSVVSLFGPNGQFAT